MVQATSCPDAPALRRFLLGQAGEQESAPLEEHLLHCDQCLRAVRTLPADDPLISALQQGRASGTPAPQSGLLEKLRLRLREMEPAARGPDTVSGENTEAAVPGPSPSPFEAAPAEPGPALAPAQMPDEIGRLGGYRILAELGRGGMGVVYKAEDPKLKRLVALKAMLPRLAADPGSHRRFLREAQAMAAVRHDHVVTVYQVDEDRGVPFLAMEFLQGLPLDQWLKAGRKPSIAQILRMGREIAEGLAAAHERGLIHRDVKPGNIWLDSAHKGRVKILDFGLARAGTEDVHLTRTGAIVGTPAYMAPEQARGEKVDARCDLFSLGCVLYKLCTGALPFAGDTTTSLLMALALDHPRPVRDLNPDVPPALADLVMRLLAKKPEERPASAREVARAIQAVEGALAASRPTEGRAAGLDPAVGTKPAGTSPVARPTPEPSATITALPAAARTTPPRRRVGALVGLIAGGALAAAAVVAVVIIIRNRNGDKVAEVNVPPGGSAVFVDDAKKGDAAEGPKGGVDDAWVKQVSALPAEKQVEAVAAKLKELNPGFDGKVTPRIDYGAVTILQFLTDNVTDISPVRALTGLWELEIQGSPPVKGRLSNLSPLKGMKLKHLFCGANPISDLAPLAGMPLEILDCGGSQVSDLSPLKGMPLTFLKCDGTPVSDLSPLKGMPLTRLTFNDTGVSDLSPLKGMKLTLLHFVDTAVSDLSPLAGMPLTVLNCTDTAAIDLSPLKGMPLAELAIAHTKVSDLSPLRDMPLKELGCDFDPKRDAEILRSLKTLETINGKLVADFWKDAAVAAQPPLDDAWLKQVAALPAEKQVEAVVAELKKRNPGFDGKLGGFIINFKKVTELGFFVDDVTDLSPLRALTGLRKLRCNGSAMGRGALADLSPLKGLKLTDLEISSTKVSDLSPLQAMPLSFLFCPDTDIRDLSPLRGIPLTNLVCNRTRVSDLTPLKGIRLTRLDCMETPVSDLSPLQGMPLDILMCPQTRIDDLSPLKGMKLTLLDCSQTKVSDLSPLRDMPLKELGCDFDPKRDAEILRSIKTLEKINGKTAADFWKDAAVAAKPPPDDAWLKQVAALFPKQQVDAVVAELKKRNPQFDGQVGYETKDGVVVELRLGKGHVTDISPLRVLPGLRVLQCGVEGDACPLADLSPLKGMKLTNVDFTFSQVSDLSPLEGMPLTELKCRGARVEDLAPLKGAPLAYVDLIGNTAVSDLSPLHGAPLTTLLISATHVQDLSPLKGMALTQLEFESTPVTDLTPLKEMPLTYLNCSDTHISDLSLLRGMKLTGLELWSTNVSDLSPLGDMKLTVLNCNHTKVSDLSPLKDMKLTQLNCADTAVSDLSLVKGMPLRLLDCNFKPERDAEILRSIKTLEQINNKPAAQFWKDVDAGKP